MTGFRPVSSGRAEVFGVFTRHGVALVAPIAYAASVVADNVDVAHIVCYGRSVAPSSESPTPEARRIRDRVDARAEGAAEAVTSAVERLGVRSGVIGLDESGLTFDGWLRFTESMPDMKVAPANARLADARRVKGPYEIECLAHALRITEEALDVVIQAMERGITERDAASLFATAVINRGAWPNPPLGEVGGRTGLLTPHPGDTELRFGNLVRFDVGCTYKGYCASVARTAVLGEPSALQEDAYQAVQASLEGATAAVAAGVGANHVFDL